MMRKLMMLAVMGLLLFPAGKANADQPWNRAAYRAVFDEICEHVETHFCRPHLVLETFPALKAKARVKIEKASSQGEFSRIVNEMLKQLATSHTYYLSPGDIEYYQLGDLFSQLPPIGAVFDGRPVMYPSVGIFTETIGSGVFIASVLPGSEAEKAGLLKGDEIVDVNGAPYEPIDSIKDHVDRQVNFRIRRRPGGPVKIVSVTPALENPGEEMLAAEKKSIRLIERDGKKIGYIHIFSYAGVKYHEVLTSAIAWGDLKDADALIIDLRYGLGGADPAYLNIFNRRVPIMTWKDNGGRTGRYDSQWRKPAVFLSNKTSRSGKEILLFGAKKYQLAAIIGERSAGAVTAGRLFPLSNRDFLYLAVRTSRIDGVELEGVGVAPDIEVPMDIRYCGGKDVQLDRAADYLIKRLEGSNG